MHGPIYVDIGPWVHGSGLAVIYGAGFLSLIKPRNQSSGSWFQSSVSESQPVFARPSSKDVVELCWCK